MTRQGSRELIGYKNELREIIGELEEIEWHVRYDYKNIGNDKCADCIRSVINKYSTALRTLERISPSYIDRLIAQAEAKASGEV